MPLLVQKLIVSYLHHKLNMKLKTFNRILDTFVSNTLNLPAVKTGQKQRHFFLFFFFIRSNSTDAKMLENA